MASRMIANPSMKKVWGGDVGTYPVIFCIVAACGWCGYMSGRALFASPDVTIDRKERGSLFKASREQKAIAWTSTHKKYIQDPTTIRIL